MSGIKRVIPLELGHEFYCKALKDFLPGTNRISCLLPINGGTSLITGTNTGVYLFKWASSEHENVQARRLLQTVGVTQIGLLEKYGLLIVISNGTLESYPIEQFINGVEDPNSRLCGPEKVLDDVNFFRIGFFGGRDFVCTVSTSTSSSSIKVLEPTSILDRDVRLGLSSMDHRVGRTFKLFKSFHIPARCWSVHFLRSNLAIGCAMGFILFGLDAADSAESQALIDPADTSLHFLSQRRDLEPLHIERMNGKFLLCYSEFSLFVNKNGSLIQPDWKIFWIGAPKSFVVAYPYLFAFGLEVVEIWQIETGKLFDVISGRDNRLLFSHLGRTFYGFEDENGDDVIACLKSPHQLSE